MADEARWTGAGLWIRHQRVRFPSSAPISLFVVKSVIFLHFFVVKIVSAVSLHLSLHFATNAGLSLQYCGVVQRKYKWLITIEREFDSPRRSHFCPCSSADRASGYSHRASSNTYAGRGFPCRHTNFCPCSSDDRTAVSLPEDAGLNPDAGTILQYPGRSEVWFIVPASGAGDRRFESGRPDQLIQGCGPTAGHGALDPGMMVRSHPSLPLFDMPGRSEIWFNAPALGAGDRRFKSDRPDHFCRSSSVGRAAVS